jgi:hypothetical protein
MELTLNLFWLLLTIPALWLWWQARGAGVRGRQVRPSAMVLGCLLLLLFPVVSATDDLQAMRPEIEESRTGDLARVSQHGRFSASSNPWAGIAILPSSALRVFPHFTILAIAIAHVVELRASVETAVRGERGPPAFLLG